MWFLFYVSPDTHSPPLILPPVSGGRLGGEGRWPSSQRVGYSRRCGGGVGPRECGRGQFRRWYAACVAVLEGAATAEDPSQIPWAEGEGRAV